MVTKQRLLSFIVILIVLGTAQIVPAVYPVGAIADNFTVKVHGTNTDASLYDYADHIIVLDFWAHWCGPCRVASSELEPYIQQYYHDLGGNPAGIPVQLISLNIQGGATAETNAYIAQYGLETVLDDTSWVAYNPFSTGGIPLFSIINGAAGANYNQWEVLYNDAEYGSGMYTSFRDIIDGVQRISPSLQTTLDPPEAVSAGAQWNVDGGPWQNSGATVGNLSSGTHTVNYKTIERGWMTPPSEQVTVEIGPTTQLAQTYRKVDINKDGHVNMLDFVLLANKWQSAGTHQEDLDFDGVVHFGDLIYFSEKWLTDYLLLQAHWKFDDGSGTSADDDTDNEYTGTLVGNPVWVAGHDGGALQLDGADDYVEISGYKGITGTASRTCSAWIKTTQTTTAEFMSWGSLDTGARWSVGIKNNAFSVRVQGGNIAGSTVINDADWHHVAVAWEPDGDNMLSNARLYIDGIEETIGSLSDIEINTAAGENVHIGNIQTLNHFQGLIDDVQIHDRALSQLEIIQMIYDTHGALISSWPFDADASDEVSANDGTLLNGAAINTSDPAVGAGAVELDGVDDYVEISGYKGITGTASRTCSAWIKTTQTTTAEFMSWGSLDTGARWSVGIKNNALSVRVQGGNIAGSTVINDAEWHHVAVAWEPDGDNMLSNARLYIDGIEETIGSLSDIEINTATSEDVHIGNIQTLNHFQGLIDDVRIYDRALGELEILMIANRY